MDLKDTYRHKGMRNALVSSLQEKGIDNVALLNAMKRVPRHFFMDSAFVEHAYQDKAFAIGEGQTISQPFTVAFQTVLLNPAPGDKTLEIGTGSGYQSSILLEMGSVLFTVEYKPALHDRAKKLLSALGYSRFTAVCGDGSLGLPAFAPYNKILVTAGAPAVPKALVEQLAPGGQLVIPVGNDDSQVMCRFTKTGEKQLKKETFGRFCFVKLLGKSGWRE